MSGSSESHGQHCREFVTLSAIYTELSSSEIDVIHPLEISWQSRHSHTVVSRSDNTRSSTKRLVENSSIEEPWRQGTLLSLVCNADGDFGEGIHGCLNRLLVVR
jgi:hypothetical protein